LHKTKTKSNGGSGMKKVKMISAALIIMLSTVIFGMSGDGGNVPVTQSENTALSNKSNSIETVKDQFGIDTGMKKEELEKFKENYFSFQKKCGIYAKDNLYYHKINLNAISKLADYDINLNNPKDLCTSNDFVIKSEIVAVVSIIDFAIEKNKELTYPVTFNVKVHEVIQNNTEYKNIPDNIIVKGNNLNNYTFDDYESGLSKKYKNRDDRYVIFLSRYGFIDFKRAYEEKLTDRIVDETCFGPFTFTFIGYQRKITNNEITFDETKYPPINISLDQFRKNVKEINRINDISNFYKRSYK